MRSNSEEPRRRWPRWKKVVSWWLAIWLLYSLAVIVLGEVSNAQAATIHQPAAGASVQQNASLYFDWAWDEDEYATSSIVFTRSSDPSDPIWAWGAGQANTDPSRVVRSDTYGPFLESHATITFTASQFASGQWYWRLCNKSIYGEDDKCSYDSGVGPRPLTVTPAPACSDAVDNDGDGRIDYGLSSSSDGGCSSASDQDEIGDPVCNDGIDNDGDGKVDYLNDSDCHYDRSGASEATPPQAQPPQPQQPQQPQPAQQAQPQTVPDVATLYLDQARMAVRKLMSRRFGTSYRRGTRKRLYNCTRVDRLTIRCRVVWKHRNYRYSGSVRIQGVTDFTWRGNYKIKRVNTRTHTVRVYVT